MDEEGKEKGTHCWELNPDCGLGGKTCRPHCPAYRQKVDCWDLDWEELASHLASKQREFWTSWFRNRCPKCPVFKMLRKE